MSILSRRSTSRPNNNSKHRCHSPSSTTTSEESNSRPVSITETTDDKESDEYDEDYEYEDDDFSEDQLDASKYQNDNKGKIKKKDNVNKKKTPRKKSSLDETDYVNVVKSDGDNLRCATPTSDIWELPTPNMSKNPYHNDDGTPLFLHIFAQYFTVFIFFNII